MLSLKKYRLLTLMLIIIWLAACGGGNSQDRTPDAAPSKHHKTLAAGSDYSCHIAPTDKQIYCWGNHAYTGHGTDNVIGDEADETGDAISPLPLGSHGGNLIQLSSNYGSYCATYDSGKVQCWGRNPYFQIGRPEQTTLGDDPNETGESIPLLNLGSGTFATATSIGGLHSCALFSDGAMKCWGMGSFGILGQMNTNIIGDDPNEIADTPYINLGIDRHATMIATGFAHTCAQLDNGEVKCWGRNSDGQLGRGNELSYGDGTLETIENLAAINLGTGRTAQAITAGASHSCALLDNGTVKCWGDNLFGQLGQGHNNDIGDAPGEMGDTLPAIDLGTGRTAQQISASPSGTCALLDDASVKCWGYNGWGELGQGHTNTLGDGPGEMGDALLPISLGTGRTATAIGQGTTCAILDDTTTKCWGRNTHGELAQGHTDALGNEPGEMGDALPIVNVGTGRTAQAVSGGTTNCFLLDDATVKCWGDSFHIPILGQYDQNGDEPNEMTGLTPAQLGPGLQFSAIAIAERHSCALTTTGQIKCWGENGNGQLGVGNTTPQGDIPERLGENIPFVELGTDRKAIAIDVGDDTSCALLDNGQIKCWGYNLQYLTGESIDTYNIGDQPNEMGDALLAVDLGTDRTAKDIAVGDRFACALLDNDMVKCWGDGSAHNLGFANDGYVGDSLDERGDNLPEIDLGDSATAIDIEAEDEYACVILTTGQVKCWGGYGNGAIYGLGVEDIPDTLPAGNPVIDLGTDRTATSLTIGGSAICAILDNKQTKCWGENYDGQLGQGHDNDLGSGSLDMGDSLLPIDLGTGRYAKEIVAGGAYNCARLDNQQIKCWGENSAGQLGQGHAKNIGDQPNEMGDYLPAIAF